MTVDPRCQTTIMICALPRSGSNLLCEALGSTQRLGNPDEWINQDRVLWNCSRFGLPASASIEQMIETLQRETRTMNGVFAFKILMYSFTWLMEQLRTLPGNGELAETELLDQYFPDLKFIYIRRRDRLGQAISLLKAAQSQVWHHNSRNTGEAHPIQFSWLGIRSLVDDLESQERAWESLLAQTGRPCREVIFEDLLADRTGVINELIDFLGIDCPRYEVDPEKLIHKPTRDATNRQWRDRYLELEQMMQGERGQIPVSDAVCQAQIIGDTAEQVVETGAFFSMTVTVTNTSGVRWEEYGKLDGSDWIKVAMQVLDDEDKAVSSSGSWRELPHPVEPGESVTLELTEQAPAVPGTYKLWVDCVLTPKRWFHLECQSGISVPLTVHRDERTAFVEDYLGGARKTQTTDLYYSEWLGFFHLLEFPTLYHRGLGYLTCEGAGVGKDEFILKSRNFGVLRTRARDFPVMWSEKEGAYVKWHRGSCDPPMLSILKGESWIPYNYKETDEILDEATRYFGVTVNAEGSTVIPWFGTIEASRFPKITHELLGTIWCSGKGAREDSFYFMKPPMGWLYTTSKIYPKLYHMEKKAWLPVNELVTTVF